MAAEGLVTPVRETRAPTIDTAVNADDAFDALAQWWPSPGDARLKSRGSKEAVSMDELHNYFKTVESLRPALYATDEIEVFDVKPGVAKRAPNLKFDVDSDASHRDAASSQALWTNTRDQVYMYNDPLVEMYYATIEAAKGSKKYGVESERSHVLDAHAAGFSGMNVTRSVFSYERDGPARGLNVVPHNWEHEVGNLVRKAGFANKHFKTADAYPDDYTLDESRVHTMLHFGATKAHAKTADELIKKFKDDPRFSQYELRVRQAQALRYAAQWARAQLAARSSGAWATSSREQIKTLYYDATDAIAKVKELLPTGGGSAAPAPKRIAFVHLIL
jgi:hypothetical protein